MHNRIIIDNAFIIELNFESASFAIFSCKMGEKRMKKLGMFVAAYFVITMAWAYPWHMVFFHDLYVQWGAFQRAEPIMVLGIAAILIQGLVIGYLYPFYIKDHSSSIRRGVQFSLIIGLMTYTAMGFATAAKFKIEPVADFSNLSYSISSCAIYSGGYCFGLDI